MTATVLNIQTAPIKTSVLGYTVSRHEDLSLSGVLDLYRAVEHTYAHPSAPDDATIPVQVVEFVATLKPGDARYDAAALFFHAQSNLATTCRAHYGGAV